MQGTRVPGHIRNAVTLTALAIALSGCLMGNEKAKSNEEIAMDNRLTGSVGDGPVAGATLRLRRNDGELVAEFISDANASYDVTIQTKARNYPLTIEASGGTDLVTNTAPDFDMTSVVLDSADRTIANVNPFTTIALEMALEMPGGINKENIDLAESYVTAELSSGLSTLIAAGPIHGSIDAGNVAEIVKSSEALAEIIRRARNLHVMYNRPTSGNQVLRAIASDLTDSMLDGQGSSRTEPRTSAIATVVAALVYLESMQNELRVNGADAMAAMDAAIMQTTDGTATTMVEDIAATADMILAVRLGLSAILAVDNNAKVAQLNAAFAGVQPGMDAVLIRSLVPTDYQQTLEASVVVIAGADDTVIDTINSVARAGVDEPNVNQAPTISGSPIRSVVADSTYSFTPSAADPEGDALTFSIVNRPSWASFSTATGRMSGTPTSANVGSFNNIIISVTDGEFVAALATFAINVISNNAAPTISGVPSTQASVNALYSFTPTASDSNGDALTFSVTGLPAWASFNSSTGRISGTPTAANVGTYSNIRITVSDGSLSSALAAFSITVNSISLGSVTLDWLPPTENEDGTALTDLAGYRFYWGTTPGSYTNSVTLNNPGLTTFVVENLAPGSYEFVATSFNASGVESAYSNPAIKVVP
jgi:hypothetical protein